MLVGAACLAGGSVMGKLDTVSNMEASGASYNKCVAEHKLDALACEALRGRYQGNLADAEEMRAL